MFLQDKAANWLETPVAIWSKQYKLLQWLFVKQAWTFPTLLFAQTVPYIFTLISTHQNCIYSSTHKPLSTTYIAFSYTALDYSYLWTHFASLSDF